MLDSKILNISPKTGNEMKCLPSPPLFNIVLEMIAIATSEGKEIKDTKIGKKELKLSLFIDNMIFWYKVLWSP